MDSEHIVFPLDAPARISGSVMDEEGDPVESATIYLFEQTLYRGLPQTRLIQQINTAGDGTFHFSRLAAGTYYAAAILSCEDGSKSACTASLQDS